MKNWKTSAAGISGGLLLAVPQIISWYQGQGADWKSISLGAVVTFMGILAKDFNVSNAPNPSVAQNVNAAPVNVQSVLSRVVLIALLPATVLLAGCSLWAKLSPTQQAKVGHVAADIGAAAINLGESWVQNTAANAIEAKSQNNYLDSAAEGIRTTEALNVTGDQLYAVVAGATQGASQSAQLASGIASQYSTAVANGAAPDAAKEAIATGLNAASAQNQSASVP